MKNAQQECEHAHQDQETGDLGKQILHSFALVGHHCNCGVHQYTHLILVLTLIVLLSKLSYKDPLF